MLSMAQCAYSCPLRFPSYLKNLYQTTPFYSKNPSKRTVNYRSPKVPLETWNKLNRVNSYWQLSSRKCGERGIINFGFTDYPIVELDPRQCQAFRSTRSGATVSRSWQWTDFVWKIKSPDLMNNTGMTSHWASSMSLLSNQKYPEGMDLTYLLHFTTLCFGEGLIHFLWWLGHIFDILKFPGGR